MSGKRIVCLGEALVDFVCERPVASLGEADYFVPRQGGSLANIAVAAARLSDRVEMVGGAGDDEWGRWLRDRLEDEGVGVDGFVLVPGAATSHAFVAVSEDGEPDFAFYGDSRSSIVHGAEEIETALSGDPGVLVAGSDTLHGLDEREVTMGAAASARARGWDVLCDPNLRPKRWDDHDEMRSVIKALVEEADVVKLNEAEAVQLSGLDNARAAAEALRGLGPHTVVVTLGANGALVAGGDGVEVVPGVKADVVDTTGAGDAVCGVIAAGMAARLGTREAVETAMVVAARVVGAWGATTALLNRAEARALLFRA